jgi:putative ABC transport system ATP-binding protein
MQFVLPGLWIYQVKIMNEPIFEIVRLRYSYNGKNHSDSSSLEFELSIDELALSRNRLTAILGRSGSGKTTLLSLLGLLRKPKEGDVYLNLKMENNTSRMKFSNIWKNEKIAETIRANFFGFALQGGELLAHLSILENVGFPVQIIGGDNMRDQAYGWLTILFNQNEKQIFKKRPSEVSQGQYHRTSLARALVHEPQIVLADEPTGNLDLVTSRLVLETLRDYSSRANNGVILVTHDLFNALKYTQEIVVLNNGQKTGHHICDPNGKWPKRIVGMIEKQLS